MTDTPLTGGCQCGAVRFTVDAPLGRSGICHCRMCQKAFGSFFAPLVTAPHFHWTRGAPRYFQSSNHARRGFCADCGTPLTFEPDNGSVELAIAAFDAPAGLRPEVQYSVETRLPWLGEMDTLPTSTPEEAAAAAAFNASIRSRQHPDHDTETWPLQPPSP